MEHLRELYGYSVLFVSVIVGLWSAGSLISALFSLYEPSLAAPDDLSSYEGFVRQQTQSQPEADPENWRAIFEGRRRIARWRGIRDVTVRSLLLALALFVYVSHHLWLGL